MTGRLSLLAFVAGSATVQLYPQLPAWATVWAWLTPGFALLAVGWTRASPVVRAACLLPLLAMAVGHTTTLYRAHDRLSDRLLPSNENQVSRLVVQVAELVRLSPDSRQFTADVLSSRPSGVPRRIVVTWNAPGVWSPFASRISDGFVFPDIKPGQRWRMAVTLRTPVALRNPNGFDREAYLFAQAVRAVGAVRGTPELVGDSPAGSVALAAERARHVLREAMLPHLSGLRYGAVLLALALGDQASVSADDWQIFNRTGITHLMSISGSHVTMVAAMGGLAMLFVWRRLRWRGVAAAERYPARLAAALAALAVAWVYCLLAGWGVPARRTFFTLAVVATAYVGRLPLDASRLLALVLAVVVAVDPWAVMTSGFWLSFAAVGVLFSSARWAGRPMFSAPLPSGAQRWKLLVWAACGLQLSITLALVPLLAFLYHEVSVVSPLVNAYAIPVIGWLVTPLSLILAALSCLPGAGPAAAGLAWFGNFLLEWMMAPTVWLSQQSQASFPVAAAPIGLVLLGLAGAVMVCLSQGLPIRHAGWLLLLPAMAWRPERLPVGGWQLTVLDVGQGGAAVVLTRHHTVLVDTGVRVSPTSDSGAQVIVPFLRSQGLSGLHDVVVSHADLDHRGGLRSVLEALAVARSWTSFPVADTLHAEARRLGREFHPDRLPASQERCAYGQGWSVDGVRFDFLWPVSTASFPKAAVTSSVRNAQACVLRLRGRHHSVLLPGDIGVHQERLLVERGLEPVDVVLAPHHGSRFSSSAPFIRATQAAHLIVQAGAWNRYGHPAPQTVRNWTAAGATLWRTDAQGAITVRSDEDGLHIHSERALFPRYWQWRMPEHVSTATMNPG